MKYILIIIILTISFILYWNRTKEHYNGKVTTNNKPIDFNECGNYCTETYDCASFAYDNNTNSCYISRTKLLGKPVKDTLYGDEYNKDSQVQCNKMNMIESHNLSFNNDIYKNNMVFKCDNGLTVIPIEKRVVPNNDINKITGYEYEMQDIKYPTDKKIDFNINQNKDIFNFTKDSDNYYFGQFQSKIKCINMSEKECLQQCYSNKNCVGTEYNYNTKACCPKREISGLEPRKEQRQDTNSSFFLKNKLESKILDTNKINIII